MAGDDAGGEEAGADANRLQRPAVAQVGEVEGLRKALALEVESAALAHDRVGTVRPDQQVGGGALAPGIRRDRGAGPAVLGFHRGDGGGPLGLHAVALELREQDALDAALRQHVQPMACIGMGIGLEADARAAFERELRVLDPERLLQDLPGRARWLEQGERARVDGERTALVEGRRSARLVDDACGDAASCQLKRQAQPDRTGAADQDRAGSLGHRGSDA